MIRTSARPLAAALLAMATLAAASIASPAAAAVQREGEAAPTMRLRLSAADFSSEAALDQALSRLTRAARLTCLSEVQSASEHRARRQCREAAVRQAVEALGRPVLTELFQRRRAEGLFAR